MDEAEVAVPVVEVGGSHATAALVNLASVSISDTNTVTLDPRASAEVVIADLLRCARALPVAVASPWAFAVPGPFDYAEGIARYEGVGKFDALRGVDLGAALRTGLGAAVSSLTFLGDAEAFAVGEWALHERQVPSRMVGITLGTGVGSSFLDSGRAVTEGPDVPPQGRVDLLTIGGRPLEETVSTRALRERYAAAAGMAAPTVAQIADRARAGDQLARQVLDTAMRALGAALSGWIRRFGAERVVVGGAMTRSWDLLAKPLTAGLGPGIAVRPSNDLDRSALFGAAWRGRRGRRPDTDED